MSVLSCARGDCPNIMCDRYSYQYGYICADCFNELVNSNVENIEEFMKGSVNTNLSEDKYKKWDKEFPERG